MEEEVTGPIGPVVTLTSDLEQDTPRTRGIHGWNFKRFRGKTPTKSRFDHHGVKRQHEVWDGLWVDPVPV